jgi:hypothetical protein
MGNPDRKQGSHAITDRFKAEARKFNAEKEEVRGGLNGIKPSAVFLFIRAPRTACFIEGGSFEDRLR